MKPKLNRDQRRRQSDRWLLTDTTRQQSLEDFFRQTGVEPGTPGFHDTEPFKQLEREDPRVMNFLANLVEARPYSTQELQDAESKIRAAVEVMSAHVERDRRHGRCVAVSGVLSRMLDELGVWNYTAKASMTVHFPDSISREPRYFYSVDENQFTAPHAIVVAPPFTLIDLTARHQAYDNPRMSPSLPPIVWTKSFRRYSFSPTELIAPSVRAQIRQHGLTNQGFLETQSPQMLAVIDRLPPRALTVGDSRVGYIITGVGGYDQQLQDLDAGETTIDGLTPKEMFQEVLTSIAAASQ